MPISAVVAASDEATVELIDAAGRRVSVERSCVDPRLRALHPGQQVVLHTVGGRVSVSL